MKKLLSILAASLLCASPALAQNAGTVTNHAFALGKGPGVTGYTSLLCTSAQLAVGQAAADPICRTLTGDVTIDAAGVTAIGANKVTNAQFRQSGALSLVGRSANSTGNVADISATPASSCVFLESASTLTCASIATANIAASAVTYAKMQNVTAARLLGNPTGGAAAPSEISLGATLTFSGTALQTLALTGDVTSSANAFATTIAANAVTNAKMATMAANTVKANATGGSAVPTDFAMPSCSSASNALTWTTSTGFGCNSIAGGGGAWSNTRLAKTAAYTTVTGDCSDTLALGGSAFYATTFNAPSGYAATCAFLVTNEDTGGGFAALSTVTTSSTSITIGTGSKVFTVSAGLAISTAQRYRVFSLANSSNYMSGFATYASTTLTLTADTISGSGTFTDWQVAPEIENPGRAKLIIPQFATSATSITIGTGAKAFTTSAGLSVQGGYQRYRVYSLANTANWMAGTAAYVGTTFTLTVDATGGSGTFTDWQIAPEIRLWPGQSRWVYNQNNVWNLDPAKRWVLPGSRELCVTQNGSDSNDGLGLGSGCFAKIQTAVTAFGQEWDGSGYYACNIGLYSGGTGIFNEAVSQTGQSSGCYLTVNVRSGSLTWQSSTWLINFGDGSILIFDSRTVAAITLKCNTSNTASVGCFYQHQTSIFDGFGTIAYLPGGSNDNLLFIDAQGRATVNWTVVIGDGVGGTFNALYNCDDNCAAINVTGSHGCSAGLTFGKSFVAYSGSKIATSATFPGCSGGSTSIVEGNSKLNTNGTTVQGGTPASPTATGGRVCTSKC